ncbi:MAG: small ribosomal subunit Rsm22 family protein [Dehalococcoidales bacterium]|nr:small ribosomal subunit Rsm22 family protein [Dehalococcoidales bacterium]
MSTKTTLSNYEWRHLHQRLDRAVAESALGYLSRLNNRRIRIDVQQLSDELDELRLGREPDYNLPGLPLFYALKYMSKRIVSIFGSLFSVLDGWKPNSVLDVGSGTGATAVALNLLDIPHQIKLLGIEPSQEMIYFSECSGRRGHVSNTYRKGSVADLAKNNITLSSDLIVFSACFPYGFDDWDSLMTAVGNYKGQESKMILIVEPDAKSDLLLSFRHRLSSRGWPTTTFCCHDLLNVIKDDSLPLPRITNIWQRLGMDDSSRPKTWWNPPDDKFLVANPKPATIGRQSAVLVG